MPPLIAAFSFETVALAGVDFADRHFLLAPEPPTPERIEAAARAGVLRPPLLGPRLENGMRRILAGRGDLESARAANIEEFVCGLAPDDFAAEAQLRIAVEDARSRGALNRIAQGAALRAWRALGLPGDEAAAIADILGVPNKTGFVQALRTWAHVSGDLFEAYRVGIVGEPAALSLAQCDSDDRAAFLRFFAELRPGANRQREFIEQIPEAARMLQKPVADLIRALIEEADAGAPAGGTLDPPARIEALRAALRRLRFPRLSAAGERFRAASREARLPAGARIEPPAGLETGVYLLSLSFETAEELEETLRATAESVARAHALREFLNQGE